MPTCTVITHNGRRQTPCTRPATGGDGMCTRHRNLFKPKPYTCRACGTPGLFGPSTCAEHKP